MPLFQEFFSCDFVFTCALFEPFQLVISAFSRIRTVFLNLFIDKIRDYLCPVHNRRNNRAHCSAQKRRRAQNHVSSNLHVLRIDFRLIVDRANYALNDFFVFFSIFKLLRCQLTVNFFRFIDICFLPFSICAVIFYYADKPLKKPAFEHVGF